MYNVPDKDSGNSAGSEHDPLLRCTIDGKYRIVSLIGQGASGKIYEAEDLVLGREVAVKVLHEHLLCDPKAQERFRQESQMVAALDHANIIKVFSRGRLENGQLYIVMDFLEGEELSALLSREHTLEPVRFFSIFEQIMDGLAFAHKKGVVHRDIKPSNILLAKTNGQVQAKILDFGLAKSFIAGANLVQTAAGVHPGTSAYMSPEQCTGAPVDGRADLYSLACVMYEALVGIAPFNGGSDMEVMYKQVHKTITCSNRLTKMPPPFRTFLAKAMQKEPGRRFQTAEEMKQALLSVKKASTRHLKIPTTASAIVCVLLLSLAVFLTVMQLPNTCPAGDDLAEPYKQELSRMHDHSDLDYLLFHNNRVAAQKKIEISRKWLGLHPKNNQKDLKDLWLAQQGLVRFLNSAGRFGEVYELYAVMLNNRSITGRHRVELMRFRAGTGARCQYWDAALKIYREALALNGEADAVLDTECFEGLSSCYLSLQRPALAEEYARKAVARCPVQGDLNHWYAVLNLEQILRQTHKDKEAQELSVRSLQELQGIESSDADRMRISVTLLLGKAASAQEREKWQEAKAYILEARRLGREDRSSMETILHELAGIDEKMGLYEEAIKTRKKLTSKILPGSDFAACAPERLLLAWPYDRSGRTGLALKEVESIFAGWHRDAGLHKTFVPADFKSLVSALQQLRYYLEKEGKLSSYPDFCQAQLANPGKPGLEQAAWLAGLAAFYSERNQHDKAEYACRQALSSLPAEKDSMITCRLQMALADELLAERKVDEAAALIKSALASSLEPAGDHPVQLALTRRIEARIAQSRGNFAEELYLRQEALKLFEAENSLNYLGMGLLQSELVMANLRCGKREAATCLLEDARVHASKAAPGNQNDLPYSYARMGECYLDLDKFAGACRCLNLIAPRIDSMMQNMSILIDRSPDNQFDAIKSFLGKIQAAALLRHDASTARRAGDLGAKLSRHSRPKPS